MRKLYLSLLLPLLMLMSQQAALWHEIGHLGDAASPTEQHKQHPGDKLCETCLAFAHFASAAKTDVPAPALPCFDHQPPAETAVVSLSADAPARRSRDPPVLL
jgi:hypothetical protein